MSHPLNNPNNIFKFQNCNKHFFESLEQNTFHFNSVSKFNDPFEMMFHVSSTELNDAGVERFYEEMFRNTSLLHLDSDKQQEVIDARKSNSNYLIVDLPKSLHKLVTKFFGVVCFSSDYQEVLMWSHYTSNGKGVCLVYNRDSLFTNLKQESPKIINVRYENKLPNIQVYMKENMFGYNIDLILGVKRNNWSYEKEVRAYANLSNVTPYIKTSIEQLETNKKLRDINYNPEALCGVILGHQTSDDDTEMIIQTINNNPALDINKIVFYKTSINDLTGLYSFTIHHINR